MPKCFVSGCRNRQRAIHQDFSLHCFPRSPTKIRRWLENTGENYNNMDSLIENISSFKKNGSYRICSAHFTPDTYRFIGYKRVLLRNAEPTIFPNSRKPLETLVSTACEPPSTSGDRTHPEIKVVIVQPITIKSESDSEPIAIKCESDGEAQSQISTAFQIASEHCDAQPMPIKSESEAEPMEIKCESDAEAPSQSSIIFQMAGEYRDAQPMTIKSDAEILSQSSITCQMVSEHCDALSIPASLHCGIVRTSEIAIPTIMSSTAKLHAKTSVTRTRSVKTSTKGLVTYRDIGTWTMTYADFVEERTKAGVDMNDQLNLMKALTPDPVNGCEIDVYL
ncbi:uncharacterized protein O3C94_013124 isoform 1-T1 [Discoglossus pictus]